MQRKLSLKLSLLVIIAVLGAILFMMHDKDAKVLLGRGLFPSRVWGRTRPLITANVTMSLMVSVAVDVRPERVYPAADVSNVFVSILTVPKLHSSRFSYQLMSWIQSFDPKQIRVITDKSSDKWIKAAQEMGLNVVFSGCQFSGWHEKNNLCCKTGRQYEEYFKAKKNGETYGWYCHVDDDMYLNAETLGRLLSKYGDPHTEHVYLGEWKILGKFAPRMADKENFVTLKNFPEAKKQGIKYAQGSTFCISDAIMKTAEKYLSGKNFEKTCQKLTSVMDDVASGAVIESILGNELTETSEFSSHVGNTTKIKQLSEEQLRKMVSVPMVLPRINNPRFNKGQDPSRLLSFHCMLHPHTSWCQVAS